MTSDLRPTVAGDESAGYFVPADVRPTDWPRVDPRLLESLPNLPGLVPTASDVMDELGLPLVVAADVLRSRVAGARAVGQAVTLRYLPERRSQTLGHNPDDTSRLAHRVALTACAQGDILVVEVAGTAEASVFGGVAALDGKRCGLGGVVVDGAVRDADELAHIALPVWSRSVTPRTGKWRVEAVQINGPVCCGGHHVVAGDLVLADESGVCFIPVELAAQAVERIVEVASRELRYLEDASGGGR